MIDVMCVVKSADDSAKDSLVVRNNILYSGQVVLEIGEIKFTVKASDLIEAICNCKNTNMWG